MFLGKKSIVVLRLSNVLHKTRIIKSLERLLRGTSASSRGLQRGLRGFRRFFMEFKRVFEELRFPGFQEGFKRGPWDFKRASEGFIGVASDRFMGVSGSFNGFYVSSALFQRISGDLNGLQRGFRGF